MDESGTSIVVGKLVVGPIVHRAAVNCMIIYFDRSDDWIMKQFFSEEEMQRYAAKESLMIIRREEK